MKYAEGVATDTTKWLGKAGKLVKILQTMATNPGMVKKEEVKNVVKTEEALTAEYKTIREWGERFGIFARGKKRGRK